MQNQPDKPAAAFRKSRRVIYMIAGGLIYAGILISIILPNRILIGAYLGSVSCQVNRAETMAASSRWAEAVKWYRKAAEQGHPGAQYELGECYHTYCDDAVTMDDFEAVKWYRKSAEQGHSKAQNRLGECYKEGDGVTQDWFEAAKWFRKAAEQGNSGAQYELGLCYANGKGVTKDHAEAVKWYRKAAEQGIIPAKTELGLCYIYGRGVKKDWTEAVKWLRSAARESGPYGEIARKYLLAMGEKI